MDDLPETVASPGFFGPGSARFGVLHRPGAERSSLGVVLCRPLGYEGVQCYRTTRLLSERLAKAGVTTLRLDYDGTGESLGSDRDEGRLEAWIDSVLDAAARVRAVPGVDRVCLVGVRMGATLALAAASRADFPALVLWEPCPSGAHFLREMEIMAAGQPRSTPVGPEDDLEVGGYRFTPETRAGLAALRGDALRPVGGPDVFLVSRDDRRTAPTVHDALVAAGCEVRSERLPGFAEMMVLPVLSQVPEVAVREIVAWVTERAGPTRADAAEAEGLAPEAVRDGVRSFPVWLGEEGRLFAVGSERSAGAADGPVVLFLAGGVVPRTGSNRMYLEAARRAAEAGATVFRMDVSGVGESAAVSSVENDAYPPTLVDDVRVAVTALRRRHPGRRVALVGLCSGAYAAFQTALRHGDVDALILLNPMVLSWHGRRALDIESVRQFDDTHRLLGLGSNGAAEGARAGPAGVSWKQRIRARSRLAARRWGVGLFPLLGLGAPALGRELTALVEDGVSVSVGFSAADPGIGPFRFGAGPLLARPHGGGVHVELFEGADHTFNDLASRDRLIEWILARLRAVSSGAAERRRETSGSSGTGSV